MGTKPTLSAEQRWNDYWHKPRTRASALREIGTLSMRTVLAPTAVEMIFDSPEAVGELMRMVQGGVENAQGLMSLYHITHMPPFHYDARRDRATIASIAEPLQIVNLGNSFARGQIDFTQSENANALSRKMNLQNNTTVFNDHINPPGRLLVVRQNQVTQSDPWQHWRQHDAAKNGGKLSDVEQQVNVLRNNGILQTPVSKMLVIGAGDNDTFLTPDIQTHFASLEQNVYQQETLRIARTLDTGIAQIGSDFFNYLERLDTLNREEGWNVSDVFLLGTPYLTYAEGIVIQLGDQYPVMSLANNGLARTLLDNVSDTINTMKGDVLTRYRAAHTDSSYQLHFLSARLPQEVVDGAVVPAQLYQHGTFQGYNRVTARMAYMINDQQGGNLGHQYFSDYTMERNLSAT